MKEVNKVTALVKSICRGQLPSEHVLPFPQLSDYESLRIRQIEAEFLPLREREGDVLEYLKSKNLLGFSAEGSTGGLGLSRLGTVSLLEIIGFSGLFLAASASRSVGRSVSEKKDVMEAEARLDWSAVCVGAAQGAFQRTMAYARQNSRKGKPLLQYQQIKGMMAHAALEIETTRRVVQMTAGLADRGVETVLESAAARLMAGRTLDLSLSVALQVAGAGDFAEGTQEQLLTNARSARIFLGSEELLAEEIALGASAETMELVERDSRWGSKAVLESLWRRGRTYLPGPRLHKVDSRLSRMNGLISEMVLILGHVTHKLQRVYGPSFVEEGYQQQRLARMIIETLSAVSMCAWIDSLLKKETADQKKKAEEESSFSRELLLARESIGFAWERFVFSSGRIYTTKHDEEFDRIAEVLVEQFESDGSAGSSENEEGYETEKE